MMAQDNGNQPSKPAATPVPLQRIEDDYRRFMRPPQTALEFWAAMRFNLGVGKSQLAAEDLKGFLAKNPTDAEILQIIDEQGMSAFLQLLNRPELRADAQALVERVNAVVKQQRGDPARLRKLVANLLGEPEERAYSIIELRKAGPLAVPYLVEFLRANDKPYDHASISQAMLQLDRSIVPPLIAAFDVDDPNLRAELIDIVYRLALKHNRRDPGASSYLWYLAAAPKQPITVRQKARGALAYFQGVKSFDQLPPAPAALTAEAERYYRHQGPLVEGRETIVWLWRDGQLVSYTVPATTAEEYFGLRFARQALELDPTYEPAQAAFLNIALEKGFERAGVDHPLETGAPDVKQLVRTLNPDLVMNVLDRALGEQRTPVILAAVQTLGDLSEVRAVQTTGQRTPALLRALNYPDRRVQFAAADAVLRIPNPTPERYAWRVVEILKRAITDPNPKVIEGDARIDRANQIAEVIRAAGFEPVVRHTGRDVLRRLNEASDIDAVVLIVDSGDRFLPQAMPVSELARARLQVDRPSDFMLAALPDTGLNFTLSQLRADINYGLLPVLILVAPDATGSVPADLEVRLRRLIERYRNVWLMPATLDVDDLKTALATRISAASDKPLTEEERKNRAAQAVVWFRRMATGEVPGYNIQPAADALYRALEVPELAPQAIEAVVGLSGADAQRQLARVVLSEGPAPIRAAAALALSRHIQVHELALATEQIKGLEQLFQASTDPKLKGNVAIVLGSIHPTARQTGTRLQGYDPPITPAPATPPPAEKEK
jgi:hypothetical protein